MWGGVFEARLRLFFPTCSPGTLAEPPLREPVLQTGPLPFFVRIRRACSARQILRTCAAQRPCRPKEQGAVWRNSSDPRGEQAARYGACASPPQKIRSNEQQRDL